MNNWDTETGPTADCLRAIRYIGSESLTDSTRRHFNSVAQKLADFLEKKSSGPFGLACGAIAALGLVERACAIAGRDCHKASITYRSLGFDALVEIGVPAVPTLERFTKGIFRDRWRDQLARSAVHQIKSRAAGNLKFW